VILLGEERRGEERRGDFIMFWMIGQPNGPLQKKTYTC
jgi:hypothetical protein